MLNRLYANVFILSCLILTLAIGEAVAQKQTDTQINKIESATFTNLEGERVSVEDFEGKLVLLDFWETWCAPCLESFKTLQKVKKKYPRRFEIVAVNLGIVDKPEDLREFIKNHDYDFTFVQDTNELSKSLEIRGIPYKVFLDPEGNYLSTQRGRNAGKDFDHLVKMIKEQTK